MLIVAKKEEKIPLVRHSGQKTNKTQFLSSWIFWSIRRDNEKIV